MFFSGFVIDLIEGQRVFGSVIGSDKSCNDSMKEKLTIYSSMLNKLAKHSEYPPRMCPNH